MKLYKSIAVLALLGHINAIALKREQDQFFSDT